MQDAAKGQMSQRTPIIHFIGDSEVQDGDITFIYNGPPLMMESDAEDHCRWTDANITPLLPHTTRSMWISNSCSNRSEELYDCGQIRNIDQIHDWEVKDLAYIVFLHLVVINCCKRYHCLVFENVGLPGYSLGCFYRESATIKCNL